MPQSTSQGRSRRTDLLTPSASTAAPRRKAIYGVSVLVLLTLLVFAAAGVANAENSGLGSPPHLTPADIEEGVHEGGSPEYQTDLADLQAAEELPHTDLNRQQTLDLMQSVFDPLLKAPAGVFDDLQVERFLSDTAAILPAGEQLESPGATVGASPAERYEGPTLIESTIPLRTEGKGSAEVVDLGLEHDAQELQPASPLVEVGIPNDLSEGISLPETGVQINLKDAPEGRSPSTIDQSVAAYPEVATDTSFAVSPTPTGVETMTVLQSADAPTSQTFQLDLPQGADLRQTEAGGAEVLKDGQPILGIAPPNALDAAEQEVPVSLSVSGDSFTLQVDPGPETALPIIVDPLYETYNWWNGITGAGGWGAWTNAAPYYYWDTHDHCDPFASPYSCQMGETSNAPGLFVGALPGPVATSSTVNWEFVVPRWFEEWEKTGKAPSSWISSMYLGNVGFWQRSDWAADPTLWMGLWNTGSGGWVSGRSASGNYPGMNGNWSYEFLAGQNTFAKLASFSLVDSSGYDLTAFRDAFVNTAIISIVDTDKPNLPPAIGPNKWLNNSPVEPITVSPTDLGLGVYRLAVSAEGALSSFPTHTMPCTGTALSPCKGSVTVNVSDYNPSVMPQGVDNVLLTAEDPLGNKSETKAVKVWVDHTPPSLSLSGTATEQATRNASQYTLNYGATDGDNASPVALSPFGSAGSGPGQMLEPKGVAIDPNGNVWVVDRANHRVMDYDKNGNFLMQFGSSGSGNGQFSDPRGIAIAPNGTIWVSDVGNNNVQAFNSSGQFIRKITNASFADPFAVAPGTGGNLWVSDLTADKLFEFNESGSLLRTVESAQGRRLMYVTGLAVDSAGDVWALDREEDRVDEFNGSGGFVKQFGSQGTGAGQFEYPVGIAVAPSGNLLVTDDGSNRVEVFQPNGHYIRQFGSTGAGSEQLSAPMGIAIDQGNTAYVADMGNHRVAAWTHADLDRQSGVGSTEVKVDGKLVEPRYAPGCATESCSISREWTFAANAYSSGHHNVEVTATDGVGLSTTKKFTITTDDTPPQLDASAEFFTMPDGWVEQRTYTFPLAASDDGGSGVTAAALEIDGKYVKWALPGCPKGGCSLNVSRSIDMATYSGGAHQASLVARDAAGNLAVHAWTINVDPKGSVSSAEAIDTLEASDGTAESTVVSSNDDVIPQEEQEDGNDPVLEETTEGTVVTGVPTEVEIPQEAGAPITIPTPEGHIEIEQLGVPGEAESTIANEAVTVSPNTDENVDTIVRPIYDGFLAFADIRDREAPETYSWRVIMGKGQTLAPVDEKTAEVIYPEDGTVAATIHADPAHDATGKELNTSLNVEAPDTVTLTVHHRTEGVVYPVVGGPGFKVGYETVKVFPPPTSPSEEITKEYSELFVSAPEPIPSEEASASTVGGSRRTFISVICGHTQFYSADESYTQACGNPFKGNPGHFVQWQAAMRGAFLYKPSRWAEQRGAIACGQTIYQISDVYLWYIKSPSECHYGPSTSDGNGGQKTSGGHYLRAQAHWEVGYRGNCGDECGTSNPIIWEDKALELHLWPSGLVEKVVP